MKTASMVFMLAAMVASAQSAFKIVGHQVFSIYDASAWRQFDGLQVVNVTGAGEILCRCFSIRTTSSTSTGMAGSAMRSYTSSADFRVYGETIVLTNYHGFYSLAPGTDLQGPIRAAMAGSVGLSSGTEVTTVVGTYGAASAYSQRVQQFPLYDMGVDYYPPAVPLTEAQKRKKLSAKMRAFKSIALSATNGSVSAATSLGMRFLNGDGTETNRVDGLYWLKKASDSGDLEASNALARATCTNTVVNPDDQ